MIVERKVRFGQGRGSRKMAPTTGESEAPAGRVPRVARIMALAIRFDQLIRDGVVADQAELAQVGHVSRARMTQIMNLLSLAPEIQEEILFLPANERGRSPLTERQFRSIAAAPSWEAQRQIWKWHCQRRLASQLT